NYTFENYQNLQFALADACDFNFYNRYRNCFDLVVSFHCLHWVDDQKSALKGIEQALRKGGKVFLRLVAKGWDPIQEIANDLSCSPKWCLYFKDYKDPLYRFSAK